VRAGAAAIGSDSFGHSTKIKRFADMLKKL
jgi:hypothetical protein